MGKKHKRHRVEKKVVEEGTEAKEPLPKLVLKVSRGITRKKEDVSFESPSPQLNENYEDSPREAHIKKKRRRRQKEEKELESADEKKRKREDLIKEDHTDVEAKELPEDQVTSAASNVEEEMEGVEPIPSEVTEEEEEQQPVKEEDESIDWNSTPARRAFLLKFVEKRKAPSRNCRGKEDQDPSVSPLQKILDNLQKALQRKDQNEFFTWPVNDVIAPGYSSIIAYPMDFSTMKVKIEHGSYNSINEYKADFVLMCENAMTYNRPETIYYKAAKRLLNVGMKIMNKERIAHLKRTYNYFEEVETKPRRSKPKPKHTESQSSDSGEIMEVQSPEEKSKAKDKMEVVDKVPLGHYDPNGKGFTENLEPHEVVKEALAAAKEAKDRLTVRNPNGKIGFLRKDEHGTTTLGILNPSTVANTDLRVANLGNVVGKLTNGSGSLPAFKEDKHNKINPVTYLTYGPFSSYAPSYDSSFSNISKEESDLLYSTYADETGIQYSKSIQDFVKDAGSYVTKFVDNLLDTLTNGEHSKTMKQLYDKRKPDDEIKDQTSNATTTDDTKETASKKQDDKIADKEAAKSDKKDEGVTKDTSQEETKKAEDVEIDFEDLKSLSNIGIDMSFLSDFEKSWQGKAKKTDLNSKLESTANLIDNLEKKQTERLSRKPPAHLQFIEGPSQEESNIAEEITQQLLQLTSNATPGDVASTPAVRKAMGVELSVPSPEDATKNLDPAADIDTELMDFLDSQPSTSNEKDDEQGQHSDQG
ncbi:bromodomain-containing protein 7-like [Antedon mediterranea]|uniref:bromodomain-containing protein 7-like n=1 Tax=Antedon mediterranea TaxID=105859 RepID=UPI003AF7A392